MKLKLIECEDWKAVHFKKRTVLRSDRCLYPEALWWALITEVDVEPTKTKGHYRVIE